MKQILPLRSYPHLRCCHCCRQGHGGHHDEALLSGRSYAAAFIIKTVGMLADKIEMLSWWTFTVSHKDHALHKLFR